MDTSLTRVSVELAVAGGSGLAFERLVWHEWISRPFCGQLDVTRSSPSLDLRRLLGASVAVTIAGGRNRVLHLGGEVDRACQLGTVSGRTTYRLWIRPLLSRLDGPPITRAFADLDIVQVVAAVLAEHGVDRVETRIGRPLPVLEAIYQHDQTDLEFVSRLMEDQGIYYLFTHGSQGEVLLLEDAPPPPRRKIGFVNARTGREGITSWNAEASRRPDAAMADGGPSGVYLSARGTASALGLSVGRAFTLTDHPGPGEATVHVPVAVVHHVEVDSAVRPATGELEATYGAELTAVPAGSVPAAVVRSARSGPGALTAVVVGPAGEELAVDEAGRVQVRIGTAGSADTETAVWARVAQPWAGASGGTTFWPCIGDEVLVEFEGGDLRRPYVVGSLYGGDHPPPLPLPAEARRTGIVGRGVEVTVRDVASQERLMLTTARDLVETVGDAKTQTIGGAKTERVGGTRTVAVTGHEQRSIGRDLSETVGGDVATAVGGDMATTVGGDMTATAGRELQMAAGQRIVLACGAASITLWADGRIDIGGVDVDVRADGTLTLKGQRIEGV